MVGRDVQRAVTLDELEDVEGNVAIGHTGMHGQQPLEDCKHELALLHIGDLQLEDAEEELTGHSFTTRTDSETIVFYGFVD